MRTLHEDTPVHYVYGVQLTNTYQSEKCYKQE